MSRSRHVIDEQLNEKTNEISEIDIKHLQQIRDTVDTLHKNFSCSFDEDNHMVLDVA